VILTQPWRDGERHHDAHGTSKNSVVREGTLIDPGTSAPGVHVTRRMLEMLSHRTLGLADVLRG
jgi:hypothetical protein